MSVKFVKYDQGIKSNAMDNDNKYYICTESLLESVVNLVKEGYLSINLRIY